MKKITILIINLLFIFSVSSYAQEDFYEYDDYSEYRDKESENMFENMFDENGEWTEEYIQKTKSTPFWRFYSSDNAGTELSIKNYQYGMVQVLLTPGWAWHVKRIKRQLKIFDDNKNLIIWDYTNYIDSHTFKRMEQPYLDYLDINIDIRPRLLVGVIKEEGKVYLIALLNHRFGSVFECDFTTGSLSLIKERKLPTFCVYQIGQDKTLSQEEGLKKLFHLICNKNYKVEMDSRTITDMGFLNETDYFPIRPSKETDISTSSFLQEGKTSYTIDNARNFEGNPFVPDTGKTFTNVITVSAKDLQNVGLIFQNGYISQKRPDLYRKNCRVKTIKITYPDYDESFEQIVHIKDDASIQFIPFLWMLMEDCQKVQIKIESVYQGSEYNDVCINYLGLATKRNIVYDER